MIGRLLDSARPKAALGQLRRAGDNARDALRWIDAIDAYRAYLRLKPADAGIWVQLGNCAKEAGDFEASLAAYDAATAINDSNADVHLQMGRLLKKMGRGALARKSFRRSLDLMPALNPAHQEIVSLRSGEHRGAGGGGAVSAASIYIDVTDLMDYLRVNLSLSGIQRVVANLITFAGDFEADVGDSIVRLAYPDYDEQAVYEVSLETVQDLVALVAIRSARDVVDRLLDEVKASRVRVAPGDRDTLLIPGAFWIYQRYDLLNRLRQDGVRVAVFIHDLIQITHPQFVEPAATTVFRRSFADVLCVSSYLLSNSVFVANDIRAYLGSRMNFTVPVVPVPLATELGSPPVEAGRLSGDITDILKEDFVLCVSTIEIRKNHLYLIEVWERLIAEGAAWIPNLVFVGKWGWQVDELRRHLGESDYLGARLFIFNGISDHELAALYAHCAFTVYPSFAEGWGLPVGESLGYGKPCVASKVTAIPEVGGDFCRYIDPFDPDDGYRVIAGVLADKAALAAWQARVARDFQPKTWQTFTGELLTVVKRLAREKALGHRGNNVILERDQIVSFGNDALAQLDAKAAPLVTGRMVRGSGWHGLESWGCWAGKRRADLAFTTRVEPGTAIVLYLFVQSPTGDLSAECTIRCGDLSTPIEGVGPQPKWFTARGRVGADREVRITIVSGRGFQHHEGHEIYVGLISFGFCVADDRLGRERLLDSIVPGGLARGEA